MQKPRPCLQIPSRVRQGGNKDGVGRGCAPKKDPLREGEMVVEVGVVSVATFCPCAFRMSRQSIGTGGQGQAALWGHSALKSLSIGHTFSSVGALTGSEPVAAAVDSEGF